MAIKSFKRRIGITGIANSGKTVFLTSLINHLKSHPEKPELLTIGDGNAIIKKFRPVLVGKGKNPFNYEKYRDTLVTQGNWPEKTSDTSHYICKFERSDWKYTGVELEFFDFPGERVADAAMVEIKDFNTWSKHIIERLDSESAYREQASKFLEMQEADKLERDALVNEYKLTLARSILNCKPLITPSTFILGEKGDRASGKEPEKLAYDRYCGRDPEEQFIPLSEKLQRIDPKLAKIYEKRYKDYRENVVLPIFNHLKSCHRLIVLVDITTLLAAGTGMYSDNKEILDQLLNALDPGADFIKKTTTVISSAIPKWKPGGITKAAFVASKADKVHPDDRGNLLALLKQIVQRRAEEIDGLEAMYSTCSAIVSTEVVNEENHVLSGYPVSYKGEYLPPGGEMQKFRVSQVPEDWPDQWEMGEYTFPTVYPIMPKRKDLAPKQFGLENILDFIMKEKFFE